MIILSACDKEYKKHMDCLVNSVFRNTDYDMKVKYINTKGMDQAQKRDLCANYRIEMFLENEGDENMLWLDSDSLVRGRIATISSILDQSDACAVFTPEMGSEGSMNRWLISTVGISAGEGGSKFLEKWAKKQEEIYSAWFPSIMTCQQSYVNVVETKEFKVHDLTYHYSDKNMEEKSPIHEAQGQRKFEHKWLKEMEKYK